MYHAATELPGAADAAPLLVGEEEVGELGGQAEGHQLGIGQELRRGWRASAK